MKKTEISISKTISYILRHHPEKFDIKLDTEGYANLQDMLTILNKQYKNIDITRDYIENINDISDKRRFEIKDNQIRAVYGHSIEKKIQIPEAQNPPDILYHGTTEKAYLLIKEEGLKKRSRQYVHLSDNIDTAIKVGLRRVKDPILLFIDVKNARKAGIKFYQSNEIYLADYIPPEFITIFDEYK